jgi:hypothetical protein
MKKYKQNLRVVGINVYSYNTHVAEISHKDGIVYALGYWSSTTSKHINYVANELNYIVKQYKVKQNG